ncbi:hypothetical protein BDW74DRAFT_174905 [Aspergillus multicolor]|uniref:uncharacterized protein n=1 Tax=Aspergillus multicolor TaxID=41759 RepID=UPI003CCD596D
MADSPSQTQSHLETTPAPANSPQAQFVHAPPAAEDADAAATEKLPDHSMDQDLWRLNKARTRLVFWTNEDIMTKTVEVPKDTDPEAASKMLAVPTDGITAYFARLTPRQQDRYAQLQQLGWSDADAQNLFFNIDYVQDMLRAELRMEGLHKDEVQRMDGECEDGMLDFSHLRRGVLGLLEEDALVGEYLDKESERREEFRRRGRPLRFWEQKRSLAMRELYPVEDD